MRMFPGARSVAIVPLMDAHKSRWFAAGFVWTKSRSRVFDRGELSYLKAFASATMAEVVRMDVLRENKAKEDVLGSLSHEIRSPLHGLFLGVELLHDSILTGFQVDVLRTVETCGRTLLDTLDHVGDDLLRYEKGACTDFCSCSISARLTTFCKSQNDDVHKQGSAELATMPKALKRE